MIVDARAYAASLERAGLRLREDGPPRPPRPRGEIELQARWYAGEFGSVWMTEDGRRVEVLDFGEWNRESGPDFCGVLVRFDGGEPRRGDVELDLDVRDWEAHGHSANSGFDRAVLHLFFRRPAKRAFTRTSRNAEVAQVFLDTTAAKAAAPLAGCAPPGVRLGGNDPAAASAILRSAAAYRLHRKASLLLQSSRLRGEGPALFEALAVALGYKNNKIPFLLLAQRVGLTQAASAGGESLLFGIAGFLAAREVAGADAETRAYLRDLWDAWWELRSTCDRLVLDPKAWTLTGIRPSNHPQRRVAALREIARAMPSITAACREADRDRLVEILRARSHRYWNCRATLQAAPMPAPRALIGDERIKDILLNVFFPLYAESRAHGIDAFARECGPPPNPTVRRLAVRLLDPAIATRGFLSSAMHQQGLLQIGSDLAAADHPEELLFQLDASGTPLG